ncbi:phosphoenolpyruvate carboxykinase, putative [Toxoplasma gondii ME49]|uniref:phosphoenolpyruvate carboxykinase (ATP) n=3 Tax=Toxoplasma gondii TaxID=5811 RepID=S8GHQ6_TOXGM|nr:phosphoenolpyruvate carboxykinase, putative [Toxoplasma gondii ME49]EPT27989.1 phosphoenolpyruvate carboxykinase, putative [Toxoplasma gondii ME49]KYF45092.1 putative phosphoenolpyruvate carboxykinase [Toxoplasma gondii ARI]|eukprot:XP_002368418.2 phosphoenolpyruvate carboxykinase, putative [Toxoplasma gondii ME49]
MFPKMATPFAQDAMTPENLLDVRRKLEHHLAHHAHQASSLTKKDVLDLGQLQHEVHVEDECRAQGLTAEQIFYNAAVPLLYEQALLYEKNTLIANTGVLCCSSGLKTRRSPEDKRIVRESTSEEKIWWGKVNIPFKEQSYLFNRERAIDFLNTQKRLFVVDGFAGADPKYRIKVRMIATRAYHALFMQNILLSPTVSELQEFEPVFTIYNAGLFSANRFAEGVSSQTSVALHLGRGEMVILGTQYAGELHKGIFTYMNYVMPPKGVLPLHASCIVGSAKGDSDISVLLGLTATGKTALVATAEGKVLADDEVLWTPEGVSGVLGGCYVRCKDIDKDPCQTFVNAMVYGSVMENVVLDEETRRVYFHDTTLTDNTRCTYPLTFLEHGMKGLPSVPLHPKHFIMLVNDTFGVFPPVARLSLPQALFYFLSGFTCKETTAEKRRDGTTLEMRRRIVTFSACSGCPFLPLHPTVYSDLLEKKIREHGTTVWLMNTGWVGGPAYGISFRSTGEKVPVEISRRIVNAIHDGTMSECTFKILPVFDLEIPVTFADIPEETLSPLQAWTARTGDSRAFENEARHVASLFVDNFKQFEGRVSSEVAALLASFQRANGTHSLPS